VDELLRWDPEENQATLQKKPWARDNHYFKKVRISASAVLKMAIHAKSGGRLEVMGLVQVRPPTPTPRPSPPPPTRPHPAPPTRPHPRPPAGQGGRGHFRGGGLVRAARGGHGDPRQRPRPGLRVHGQLRGGVERGRAPGERLRVVPLPPRLRLLALRDRRQHAAGAATVPGPLRGHRRGPGQDGCGRQGRDRGLPHLPQGERGPRAALAPYPPLRRGRPPLTAPPPSPDPQGFTPTEGGPSEYQTIPLEKIEEFGIHAKQYYALEVSFFRSKVDAAYFDLMWAQYWAATLSENPLAGSRPFLTARMNDLCAKLDKEVSKVGSAAPFEASAPPRGPPVRLGVGRGAGPLPSRAPPVPVCPPQATKKAERLKETVKDTGSLAVEALKGLSTQVIKQRAFASGAPVNG